MNLDVRRVWECPACGRRLKREGEVTGHSCHCQEPPVWMRLVETRRAFREYQPYIVPEIGADEVAGDEEPAAAEPVRVEVAVLDEIPAPAEMEEVPAAEEEFFSPEELPVDELPRLEPPAPEPAEPIASEPPSEPAPEPAATSDRPPEQAPQEPRGKSRRRRSGRKRNRHRDTEKGG